MKKHVAEALERSCVMEDQASPSSQEGGVHQAGGIEEEKVRTLETTTRQDMAWENSVLVRHHGRCVSSVGRSNDEEILSR